MNYTTQMNAARQGIVTPQMKHMLTTERISEEDLLLERIAREKSRFRPIRTTFLLPAAVSGKGLPPKSTSIWAFRKTAATLIWS